MTEPRHIWIGWDPREAEAAEVLAWSIRRHSSVPVQIRYVCDDLLESKYGFKMDRTRPGSTAFTYARFAIPWLEGYMGTSLFIDCDAVCFGDVAELFALPMEPFAIRCVHHDQQVTSAVKMDGKTPQEPYPRKNFSSVMLLNNAMLQLWTKEAVETWAGAQLHRFTGIPDPYIAWLDPCWNSLDRVNSSTRIWHLTSGGPWFEASRNCPGAERWIELRNQWLMEGR